LAQCGSRRRAQAIFGLLYADFKRLSITAMKS
jgi:hypothetical protein